MSRSELVCEVCRVRPAVGVLFTRRGHLYWKQAAADICTDYRPPKLYCRECVPEFVVEVLRCNGIPLTEERA